jgi:hypothetical protein
MGMARTGKGWNGVLREKPRGKHHGQEGGQHPHENKYAADSGPGSTWYRKQKVKYRTWEKEEGIAVQTSREATKYVKSGEYQVLVGGPRGLLESEVSTVSLMLGPNYWRYINGANQTDKPVHKLIGEGDNGFYVQIDSKGRVSLPMLKWDNLGRDKEIPGKTNMSAQIVQFNDIAKIGEVRSRSSNPFSRGMHSGDFAGSYEQRRREEGLDDGFGRLW